ncbi:hypothetical protein QA596_01285 [Balneolales bacterium ANBcel1]|nr:hypothetical protein [Balneolales bacterium ANBcel1]
MRHIPSSSLPKKNVSPGRRVTSLMPGFMLLLALGWMGHDLPLEERIVLFRYLAMAFAGVMAFITPHLLFPDADKTLILQLNLSPRKLFLHHCVKLRPLWGFAMAALLLTAFGDAVSPAADTARKLQLLGTGALALSAIMLYALYRFVTIGGLSQRWHEGKIGRRAFDSMEKIGKGSPVSAGMYPTFISTILVTFAGMMIVVIASAIPHPLLAILPYAAFAGYAGTQLYRAGRRYDRLYYQSDAFYDELFTNPSTGLRDSREPARYEAIYWVPGRWRPAVWSQLIQLDRKRPMGRIIALLTFTYWLLIWLGVPESWHALWLVFWVMAKNLLAWPASDRRISPPMFHWWMMPPRDWVIVRFFMQVRWTLALFLTVAAAAVMSGAVGWTDVWFWTAFDLGVCIASAWVITRSNEYAFQRKYA